jgi:regulator of sigma E protease
MQFSTIQQIAVTVLSIGILIFVHELGHFWMAKKTGVRVLTFSLGFGKKLLRRKWHGTEYVISAIPLGGYVKMAGDNPEEEITGASWEFINKPFRVKALIVLAGPFMNVLLALLLFWVIFWTEGIEVYAPVIGNVSPESPAEQAGLHPLDRILEINGMPIDSWRSISPIVSSVEDREILTLKIEREGERNVVEVRPEYDEDYESYLIGISPYFPPVVGKVVEDGPAEKAGLQTGDSLTVVMDEKISTWDEAIDILTSHPREQLAISWVRNGRQMHGTITPEVSKFLPESDEGEPIGQPGMMYSATYKPLGPFRAFPYALGRVSMAVRLLVTTIRVFIRGEVQRDTLIGPIGIVYFTAYTFRYGIAALLFFIANLSVNLAFINLLPIPILDGGQFLFFLVERIIRKQLSVKLKAALQLIGLIVIGFLIIGVTMNDLSRMISK